MSWLVLAASQEDDPSKVAPVAGKNWLTVLPSGGMVSGVQFWQSSLLGGAITIVIVAL